MNRKSLAVTVLALCGGMALALPATAAHAQPPVDAGATASNAAPPASHTQATHVVKTMPAIIVVGNLVAPPGSDPSAYNVTLAKAIGGCIRSTGSHIKPAKDACSIAASIGGEVFTRATLERGDPNPMSALSLDPAISLQHN